MDKTEMLNTTANDTHQKGYAITDSAEDEDENVRLTIESEFTDNNIFISDSLKIIHKEEKVVVGGIFTDSDAVNPFHDMDCLGSIYHYGKRSNGKEEQNHFLKAVGYTSDEEPDMDNEHVKKELLTLIFDALRKIDNKERQLIYKAIFDSQNDTSTTVTKQDYAYYLIEDVISNSDLGDLAEDFCEYALDCRRSGLPEKMKETLVPLFDILNSNDIKREAWEKCTKNGTIGNIHARSLDIYEHGGVSYSLHGEGMQCMFDTSKNAAVWVPDEEAIENANYQAFNEITGITFKTEYQPGETGGIVLYMKPGENFHGSELKARSFNEMINRLWGTRKINRNVFDSKVQKHITEAAKSALEVLNCYLNGECYFILVHEIDPVTGDILDTDSVHGFYGLSSAEAELLSLMA
jgi:hypothetical protein